MQKVRIIKRADFKPSRRSLMEVAVTAMQRNVDMTLALSLAVAAFAAGVML